MAHWTECAVTNDGAAMLNEWMAGSTITISSACGGTGLVPEEQLAEQTRLLDQKQTLSIVGQTDGEGGKNLQLQVFNQNLKAEYILNQIGVYARLDAERDPEAEERLLFLMQDRQGVTVPAGTDESFLLELYCLIGITNNGRFHVTVDSMGIVTVAHLRESLERAMEEHNAAVTAHPALRGQVAEIDARLSLLELMYATDVRGNPFTVGFDTLSGLEATGVWNAAQRRLEF